MNGVLFLFPASNAVLVNNVSRTDKLNMRELLDPDGTGRKITYGVKYMYMNGLAQVCNIVNTVFR